MDFSSALSELEKFGAEFIPPAGADALPRTQGALQALGRIMLPLDLAEVYKSIDGIFMGDAEMFGLESHPFGRGQTRTIAEVNSDLRIGQRTIFGRNGLFFLVVDTDSGYALMDIYTLRIVKKYDGAADAIRDCLLVGAL
ncbi:MAG: hypothetical protein LBB23_03880 [Rickettsiales bacterium]|jgi:hypothetical protein|nr:hypothetical protein [Rickettsiales bacterium]